MIDILIDKLIINSNGYTAIDITDTITDWLRKNKAKRGFVTINAPRKGCIVTLIEYESNLLSDLEEFLARYGEKKKIVLEGLFGKSIVLPVVDGAIDAGVFKRIVFIDISEEEGPKEVLVGFEGVHD
ncbi:MAG: YjbQ family protein [Staphylothermus sp.]|nr:YjbQ family protein [Staphylothermus sp.]